MGPASTDNRTNKILKCCYTSESPVKETLWCNFHLSSPNITTTFLSESHNKKGLPDEQKNIETNEELKNCICILDSNHIKFFPKSGKEFAITLQFEVLKIWPIKYGVIFERALEKKDGDHNISEVKLKLSPDSPIASPQSFRIPYYGNSRSLHRTSLEQSVFQNQRSMTDTGDRSFASTQYFNMPSAVYGADLSPIQSLGATQIEMDTSKLPIIFSLSHPLDEICPVVSKHGNSCLVLVSNLFFVTLIINTF